MDNTPQPDPQPKPIMIDIGDALLHLLQPGTFTVSVREAPSAEGTKLVYDINSGGAGVQIALDASVVADAAEPRSALAQVTIEVMAHAAAELTKRRAKGPEIVVASSMPATPPPEPKHKLRRI